MQAWDGRQSDARQAHMGCQDLSLPETRGTLPVTEGPGQWWSQDRQPTQEATQDRGEAKKGKHWTISWGLDRELTWDEHQSGTTQALGAEHAQDDPYPVP